MNLQAFRSTYVLNIYRICFKDLIDPMSKDIVVYESVARKALLEQK